jgi:ABC-2 type transport system permease protein
MVENAPKTFRSRSIQAVIQVFIVLGIAVAVNIICNLYFRRIDLTGDKRFTLSTTTKNILKGLKDQVFVKVYLSGKELPPDFKKLSESTIEILDEFRVIAGNNVGYQFINPDDLDEKEKKNLFKQLADKGLPPIEVEVKKEGEQVKKLVVPGAIVTYNNKDFPVELLEQQRGDISPSQVVHNSTIDLEYQLMNAIHKLQQADQPKIAFIQGHGELKLPYIQDIAQTLSQFYRVDFVNLPDYKIGRLDPYQAIVIAKPDSMFTPLEQYKIDQYLMNGGKALWLVSSLNVPQDSFKYHKKIFSSDYKLGIIEDQLFKYGVRINYDIVQDINNCHYLGLTNPMGGPERVKLFKWPYYPLALPTSNHPIVNNLGAVWFQYPNSMDTVSPSPDVKKTILLQTSPYTMVQMNPAEINLDLISSLKNVAPMYRQGSKILAVLMEGSFKSAFISHKPMAEALDPKEYGAFRERSKPTKMIVVSNGDVIENQVIESKQMPMPLGYDYHTDHTFSNKTFIMNCIDYMVDESGLIALRSKDIPYRPLDAGRVKEERLYWQMLNIALPLALIVLFGVIFNYIRKRRFAV